MLNDLLNGLMSYDDKDHGRRQHGVVYGRPPLVNFEDLGYPTYCFGVATMEGEQIRSEMRLSDEREERKGTVR